MKIAIASGKGGTGKTMVSTNLFYSLKTGGIDVVLGDCDAEEPNAKTFFDVREMDKKVVTQKVPVIDTEKCTFCGRCHDYCNYNAIIILPPANFIQVIEDLCHGCGACTFACNDGAITEKEVPLGTVTSFGTGKEISFVEGKMKVGVFSPVNTIKDTIKSIDGSDITLLDAPPGTSCPFIQTVDKADYVILVTEPTPFGLSDLKQSVNTLRTMDKPFGIVINRAGLGNREIYDYLRSENADLLMEIPFSRTIAESYANGNLIAEKDTAWQMKFLKLFNDIQEKYGNSHYQR